jgi:hypothetical protein
LPKRLGNLGTCEEECCREWEKLAKSSPLRPLVSQEQSCQVSTASLAANDKDGPFPICRGRANTRIHCTLASFQVPIIIVMVGGYFRLQPLRTEITIDAVQRFIGSGCR